MISVNQKWVYLVVITSVKFSCFVSVIFGSSVVLMSLFSLFYVTCEGYRFLSTEAELSVIFITSHTHYGLISDFLKTCPHCRVNVSPVQIDVVRNQESLVKDKLSLLVFLSTKKTVHTIIVVIVLQNNIIPDDGLQISIVERRLKVCLLLMLEYQKTRCVI